MQWLISYDIADDTRRQHLVKVLLDYGHRVQESVFWVDADDDTTARMQERVRHAVNPAEDSVWITPLCSACSKKIATIGPSRVPEIPEFYFV